MRALSTMIIKDLNKRCARCGELYEIPNVRTSKAREAMIQYYPCMHCGYEKDHGGNKSGRCRDCAIPFNIIDHQAQGRCNRCYMRFLRKTPRTQGDFLPS